MWLIDSGVDQASQNTHFLEMEANCRLKRSSRSLLEDLPLEDFLLPALRHRFFFGEPRAAPSLADSPASVAPCSADPAVQSTVTHGVTESESTMGLGLDARRPALELAPGAPSSVSRFFLCSDITALVRSRLRSKNRIFDSEILKLVFFAKI